MKKVFAIVLVVCLTVGMAFAADDIKVGVTAGFDSRNPVVESKSDNIKKVSKASFGGFDAQIFGEYELNSFSLYAKASFAFGGLKNRTITTTSSTKTDTGWNTIDGSYNNITLSMGIKEYFKAGKDIKTYAATLVDVSFDNFYKASTEKTDLGIGLSVEAGAEYEVDDDFSIIAGAAFNWVIYDQAMMSIIDDPTNLDYVSTYNLSYGSISTFEYGFKFFAGATYAL